MRDGFAIGYDPCHGFDHCPGSPYYRPTPTGDICPLCGEPICEGDEILESTLGGENVHLSCFEEADTLSLYNFLGYKKTTA